MRVLFFTLLALAALCSLAAARPFQNAVTRGWIFTGAAPEKANVSLVFAIRQKNMRELENLLLDVSNPKSRNFGRYLTLQQVGEMTADREATDAVLHWLHSHGVADSDIDSTINGEFLRVNLPIPLANQLLGAQFYEFRHPQPTNSRRIYRSEHIKLPAHIAPYVELVAGAQQFPNLKNPRVSRRPITLSTSGDPFPPGFCYPTTIFNTYNITSPIVATTKATQSVFETLGQSYTPSDLTAFQQTMNVTVQAIDRVVGPNDANSCANNPENCGEASLDVQYIMAVAQQAPTVFWSIPSSDQQPYLDFLYALGKDSNPPLVHSISYGDVEVYDDPSLMNRFSDEAIKLGARGLSVIVASGDDGVANFPARGNASACGFFPAFPASAVYVTAVGATQGPENNTAEVACTSSTGGGITTGGGFSNVFSQPSYQANAVSNYFSTANLPPKSMWNSSGRGYPDVAMLGHNYIVADGGQFTAASGTSASAPVFAAVITLANSARLAQGKSPLGFLNQILYNLAQTTPNAFNDITSGENNCAAGDVGSEVCCQYGFYAAPGWDPVSGLGSVNFPVFLQAVLDL